MSQFAFLQTVSFTIDLTYRLSVGLVRHFLEVINNSAQENRIMWIKKKKKGAFLLE